MHYFYSYSLLNVKNMREFLPDANICSLPEMHIGERIQETEIDLFTELTVPQGTDITMKISLPYLSYRVVLSEL